MSEDLQKQFYDAINSNSTCTILELLKSVDPSIGGNFALRSMAVKGNLLVINKLLEDQRVNSIDDLHLALFHAVNYGNYDVVDRMLRDPRIDPTAEITTYDSFKNTSIKFILNIACHNRNERIINRLLEDQRIVEWVQNANKENNMACQAVALAYESVKSVERIFKKISDLLEQSDTAVAP